MFTESVREDQRGTAFSLLSLTWFLPGFYSHLMAGFLAERYGDLLIVGILLVQAVKGVAVALWDPSSRSYLSNSVPDAESGKFFGCLAGLRELVSFPAPVIGAFIFEAYGFQGAVLAGFLGSLLAVAFSFRIKPLKMRLDR